MDTLTVVHLFRNLEATAYSLKKDELSEVVETEFGFHIIQLMDRKGNRVKTRHILIKPEITDNDRVIARTMLDSVVNLVRVDSMSF